MIEHLSGEQISQWMMGERSPQMQRHLAGCDDCRGQLEQLESTLVQFRGAMRTWGGTTPIPAWTEPPRRFDRLVWSRLVLAAATLLLAIALPLYWNARARERAAEAARSDAQLLDQVNSELSRAVPEPMEPLVNLVTWNSNPVEEKQKAARQ